MKLLVVGGHSRNIGKTSAAASILSATRDLGWLALKITQYGHHVCSTSGQECGCVVEDPDHPFAITQEQDQAGGSDTARLLQAGAKEVYWVRTRSGDLEQAMPDLRQLIEGWDYVLMESNSILRFVRPNLYLSVLQYEVDDFKLSSRLYLPRADAFIVPASGKAAPQWPGIDRATLQDRPVFAVEPPEYCSAELLSFVRGKMQIPTDLQRTASRAVPSRTVD